MNERLCHRCETVLHIESDTSLTYCFHCGAPQITLSEELQAQAEERLQHEQQDAEHQNSHLRENRSGHAIDWRKVIQLSVITSCVLAALSIVLPPLALLVFAWAPVVPAVVLSLYAIRSRPKAVHLSAGIGARVGAICGSFIVLSLALLNTVALCVVRFALHRNDFDTSVNTMLAQIQSQTAAQSGAEATADVFNLFAIPDFRAGFFLTGFALMTIFVMLLATGGGALSGFFQRRRRVS